MKFFHQTGQPQRRLPGRFRNWHDQRQEQERERRREQHADHPVNAELLVAVHRRGRHHAERGHRRQRADGDGQHEPFHVPPDARAIQACRVVEVVDDVDRVIHRDADGDGRKAHGHGGQMFLPEREYDAAEERADERRQERHQRQPPAAKGREAQQEHRHHAEKNAARRIALDEHGVVLGHAMPAGDGDVDAGELFLHVRHHEQQIGHERFGFA